MHHHNTIGTKPNQNWVPQTPTMPNTNDLEPIIPKTNHNISDNQGACKHLHYNISWAQTCTLYKTYNVVPTFQMRLSSYTHNAPFEMIALPWLRDWTHYITKPSNQTVAFQGLTFFTKSEIRCNCNKYSTLIAITPQIEFSSWRCDLKPLMYPGTAQLHPYCTLFLPDRSNHTHKKEDSDQCWQRGEWHRHHQNDS